MKRDKLRGAPVEVLLPGFITATADVQSGSPCIAGTRIPTNCGWPWGYLNKPRELKEVRLSREQVIAMAAFDAGYQWHRKTKRRKAFEAACDAWWQEWAEANP